MVFRHQWRQSTTIFRHHWRQSTIKKRRLFFIFEYSKVVFLFQVWKSFLFKQTKHIYLYRCVKPLTVHFTYNLYLILILSYSIDINTFFFVYNTLKSQNYFPWENCANSAQYIYIYIYYGHIILSLRGKQAINFLLMV